MSTLEDLSLLYRIARYYYLNENSQAEIAKLEKLSRPQISRLLRRAKELGIVRIMISPPENSDIFTLQARLKEALGLNAVYISPSAEKNKENMAGFISAAATYLSDNLGNFKSVGIGWGKSMYYTSFQLSPKTDNKDTTFYPVVGNSGTNIPYYQINSITDRFADKFHAKAYFTQSLFLAPVDQISEITRERLAYLKSCWANLDAVVIGLGGRIISPKIFIDEMPPHTQKKLLLEHTIGDIYGNFFMDDHTFFAYPKDYQLTALNPDALKRIDQVFCIAIGLHKVDAIRYAAQTRYIKTLITDDLTARAVLDSIKSESQR